MAWSRLVFEAVVAVIAVGVFCLKIANYADPAVLRPSVISHGVALAVHNTVSAIENLAILNHCPGGLDKREVDGGYVCVTESGTGPYAEIYGSYPLVGKGRESIYSSTDEGSLTAATDLLRNQVDLPRYRPVHLPPDLTWSENPYAAPYWRLEFYSLRPTLNLLYAYRTTGNVAYAEKLLRLDSSFIAAEGRSRWAWADPYAVALRSMALVDTWWKLRQGHQLPESMSTAILRELEKTGRFLADPNHYNAGDDSLSVTEAAALYELGVAFPTLPNAPQWLSLAKDRLRWQLALAIDPDGQLIDNSPYYDFSVLDEYWQIYEYSIAQGYPISADYEAKFRSMLNFASYILQPNTQIPLLGASVEEKINDYGVYEAMAGMDPEFRYVLTQGAQGSRPSRNSISFPASALTIMRSGWGSGAGFGRSTYLTYNAGRYRTGHSDLDALGLTLYGDGGDLLPDPGLYTETPGPYRDYFHGTMSHNTVVVDGKSQAPGNGTEQPLVTKDGLTYQSAESSLYPGVTHRRLVMMIDASHVLVADRLSSTATHTYQQMFHLFPGARLSKSGLTVSGIGGRPRREVTIQQLLPGGITESDTINRRGRQPDGLCSTKYGKLLPCYAVSYSARGKDATFLTLLTIGSQRSRFAVKVSHEGQHLHITDGRRNLRISLGESAGISPRSWATDPAPPPVRTASVPGVSVPGSWTVMGAGSLSPGRVPGGPEHAVAGLSTNSGSPVFMQDNRVRLNLERNNLRLRLKVNGLARLSEVRLRLSNDHWAKWVTTSPLTTYTSGYAGQWVNLFLGPSAQWGSDGGWHASAPGFNWASIDGIEIEMITRNRGGSPATVSIGGLTLLPSQDEGKLVFMFDSGYQSVLPAARYLHQHGMAGDVGVVGKYVDYPAQSYLNVFQLRTLQNNWGWNVVNQTQQDVNAIQQYSDRHDSAGYVQDFAQQAAWLEANRLNSAPNWLIYPHGSTNAELERIVSHYYMFAPVVADGPDAYPYGDPHEIADLEIRYSGDGKRGGAGFTPPAQVLSAVHQAVVHHMTLILTFSRIDSEPGDLTGYPLSLFREVVNGVRRSGIRVMTFSELDRSNGIPVRNRIGVTAGRPSQITVTVAG